MNPGRSLRLDIASSRFPLFVPHPGTDENPRLAARGSRAPGCCTPAGKPPGSPSRWPSPSIG